ncbi:MAG TPA: 23S rRNA (pseudouridine(1915)-N(3))-methyltransferase RlmH [Bacteroidales bacterium]|nr:23S rRNA (pseudouridine(1915)-N(3))-methyltransferase RlmH [Bacteroidales bacterium]HQG36114.1 23S rRNA (pseudouridine(1915)-N(3))-methyltransferase RlmH [Bacteroidales bacterium]HQG52080.1 23S rRNA (pseudouridine(1915)-N(3))-methyltransferase RlmH [Bacteroidales bacterium]HQJ20244.1 23S rRNA (pseudouridine(1915)-N(3))-methyltransferase RlmH [Bacteroidales bacterium]
MKIILLLTGKTTEKYIIEGVSNYSKRIARLVNFEIITIPDLRNTGNMTIEEVKLKEGKQILNSLTDSDYTVLLDEKGKQLRTIEFAQELEQWFMKSAKRIVFITGGAWGVSDEIFKRADNVLALSRMTFPHQLVRLLFAEQLYRALSIIKGTPYHHE